ncbi:MAG: ABC transporter permease [Planctomycetales bacterium]
MTAASTNTSAEISTWRWVWSSLIGPLLALLVVFAFFAIADQIRNGERATFLTTRSLKTTAVQAAPIVVGALGMTLIIISGGIDLSAGTALALCATVLADRLKAGTPPWLAILMCTLTGCLIGVWNGTLINSLRVVPFIVTLGTMTLCLGIGKMIAEESTVHPLPQQIPPWLDHLLSTSQPLFLGLPAGIWLAFGLAFLLSLVLRYTVFGRHLYAIGSNEATARLCGVNVPGTKIVIYALAGLFTGLAGMYHFARLSSGDPASGTGLELKIIAAVVIGGASLEGGRGTVLGTLSGAAIMSVISNGCTHLHINNPVQDIILGLIIISAVTVDQFRQRGT